MLCNERFMVPELLFSPTDVGMDQAGIPEAVVQAVTACHPSLHALLYANVVLTGGSAKCPGFRDRFAAELRPLVPDDCMVHVCMGQQDPSLTAWRGMAQFVASGDYWKAATSRQQWEANAKAAARQQQMAAAAAAAAQQQLW